MFCLVVVFIFAVATTSYGRNINISSRPSGHRIMGGEDTTIEEHPYQISLEQQNNHTCGGSLIRPNVVLTAAHCMEFAPNSYLVRAGSTIRETGGQVAQITDVCSHSKYDGTDYDVSVLKLNKPLNLNSAVQLINLQNVGEKVQGNTTATLTGWGYLNNHEDSSKILQKVELPKVDEKKCQNLFLGLDLSYTDRMTCYGYTDRGKDARGGDSGGPLVANGKQIGIVSWGIMCINQPSPSVYTRLENEEIHNHINTCLEKFRS